MEWEVNPQRFAEAGLWDRELPSSTAAHRGQNLTFCIKSLFGNKCIPVRRPWAPPKAPPPESEEPRVPSSTVASYHDGEGTWRPGTGH